MTRVAAIQMTSGADVEANLAAAGELIEEAAAAGAELVCLPENFGLIGKSERVKLEHAEPEGDGPQQAFLARAAARHGIWIAGGTVPLTTAAGDRVRQSLLVYDPEGRSTARYDKIHLFDVQLDGGESYRESSTIEPGDSPVAVETPFGRLGLTICYDLRFPELYRQLALEGATILLVPSAFTRVTGRAHWEPLLRARAIENLAWVVAPAQEGRHNAKRETWGHAMIVDPWGAVVAEQAEGSGVVVADIDDERLRRTRSNFPVLEHRRLS